MSASTGLVLAVGGIHLANETIFNGRPMEWRTPIATGIAALIFSGMESLIGSEIPRALAMVALVTVVFTRVDPRVPAPAESALTWFEKG